ncbi:TPA: restriction endonuclease subunit S [Vibrio vulnificus]
MANQMLTIGDIAEIFDGPHATPKKIENGPYFLSISSLEDGRLDLSKSAHVSEEQFVKWTKRVTPQKGDLLFSYETRLGEAALMPEGVRACLGRRMGLLRPKLDKVIPEYLLYAYISPFFQQVIKANTIVGATVDRIALSEMKDFPIRIPNLSEQKAACLLLSTIDKKIELNNRINSELEAMAKTLYDYWFVQFDFPDANGKPYKASGGKMVYNDTLKRKIPEGWEVRPFSEHLTCNAKKLGKKHEYSEIQYLDTANLTKNVVDTLQPLVVSVDKIPSRANMIVSKNDILYSTVRPNQLHYGIITQPVENMVASTGYSVLSHKSDSSINVLFYLHLTNEANTQRLIKISESSKSSYPSISPDDILSIDIALPKDGGAVDKAVGMLNPLFKKISETQRENKELASLRDWLLPMLMNGQVKVKLSTESQEALHG